MKEEYLVITTHRWGDTVLERCAKHFLAIGVDSFPNSLWRSKFTATRFRIFNRHGFITELVLQQEIPAHVCGGVEGFLPEM